MLTARDVEHWVALGALSGSDRDFRVRLMPIHSGLDVELRCDSLDPALFDVVLTIADAAALREHAKRIGADRSFYEPAHHLRAIYTSARRPIKRDGGVRRDRPRRDPPHLHVRLCDALNEALERDFGLVALPSRGPHLEFVLGFPGGRIDRLRRYKGQ